MNLNPETPIAIIGLGYVGLPLAVEFGKKRKVVGFDINAGRIEELRAGRDGTLEVEPEELREATGLRFTTNPEDLLECTCFIVTVPTPIDAHKRPDLTPLIKASETVGKLLKPGDIVIYESTVYPGCTEEDCVPILERESGLEYITASRTPQRNQHTESVGQTPLSLRGAEGDAAVPAAAGLPRAFGPRNDGGESPRARSDQDKVQGFHVGYSPERINPGDKAHRVASIRKVTSGSTPEIAETVDALYREIITAGTHKAESIQVAEAAKVIENTQRDLNIALMNELSVLFARMNIDTHDVLRAAGTKWNFLPFRPGLVGGHCIGVDPYYLTHKAEKVGYIPQVILAGRRINDNMGRYVARATVKRMVQNGIDVTRATVGVMGLTFKENCPDLRNSRVIDIIRELQDYGIRVIAEDAWADPGEIASEYPGLELAPISEQAPVDALIVAVAHHQYAELDAERLRSRLKGDRPVLADVKSIYDRQALTEAGITVWRL